LSKQYPDGLPQYESLRERKMTSPSLDYVERNRASWTSKNLEYTDGSARDAWLEDKVSWGIWHVDDGGIGALPQYAGKDVIELGCGTAYFAAWLKKGGAARVVGVDITPAQLATAQRLNDEFGLGLELLEANAEAVALPDDQFDLAISEYGASIWCDPALWIPEAARLLRPGGELVFLRNSTIQILCMPDTGKVQTSLQRPQRGMYRLEWDDSDAEVEFHAPTGDLLRILHKAGFDVLDIIELYPPADAVDHPYYSYVTVDWASRWPAEEIWKARLR
jgi:SAM-dependent methyltransferase